MGEGGIYWEIGMFSEMLRKRRDRKLREVTKMTESIYGQAEGYCVRSLRSAVFRESSVRPIGEDVDNPYSHWIKRFATPQFHNKFGQKQ